MDQRKARRLSIVFLAFAWAAVIASLPAPAFVEPFLFRSQGHTRVYEYVGLVILSFMGQPNVFSPALSLGVVSFILCPLFVAHPTRKTWARVVIGVLLCAGLAAPWI